MADLDAESEDPNHGEDAHPHMDGGSEHEEETETDDEAAAKPSGAKRPLKTCHPLIDPRLFEVGGYLKQNTPNLAWLEKRLKDVSDTGDAEGLLSEYTVVV